MTQICVCTVPTGPFIWDKICSQNQTIQSWTGCVGVPQVLNTCDSINFGNNQNPKASSSITVGSPTTTFEHGRREYPVYIYHNGMADI